MDGLHIVANLYGCKGDARFLTDGQALRRFSLEAVERAGLTTLGDLFHEFPAGNVPAGPAGHTEVAQAGGGVTGCVVLAESHLAMHTWPEFGTVTLDVYVCNYTQNNDARARAMVDEFVQLFAPADVVRQEVPRDRLYMNEWLNPDYGFFLRSSQRIASTKTRFQDLEIHDTPQFGKLFRLDGCNMTSEREEFYYHENLVHPAAMAHPNPKRALIVGGGDGGSSEEMLKHPSIEKLVLVELDDEVVRIAREHFQSIHRGAFDDARLELRIEDGLRYLAETSEQFDLIALDLPDPIGPATLLYEAEFFRNCRRALAPGGVLTLHMGSPVSRPDRVREIFAKLAAVFPVVKPFTMFIPLYGALWSMACCSDTLDPTSVPAAEIGRRIARRGVGDLQYYNPETHHAVFALPNFMRDLTIGNDDVARQRRKRLANG